MCKNSVHGTFFLSHGVVASRGPGVEVAAFSPDCLYTCLFCYQRGSFIYFMALAWYFMSDEGLSSRRWNDNSTFPEFRGGVSGWGMEDNFPSPTRSSLPPPDLPSFSLHTDGVPMMLSRCLRSASAWTKTHCSSRSPPVLHARSPATHRLVKETHLWPDRLPGYELRKRWLALWIYGLPQIQKGWKVFKRGCG